MSNSSICLIDRTLLGATTPNQSWSGSNVNEGVFCIPQSFCITGASPSDCFMSYLRHSFGRESYPSAEMQSLYSTATLQTGLRGIGEISWYILWNCTYTLMWGLFIYQYLFCSVWELKWKWWNRIKNCPIL